MAKNHNRGQTKLPEMKQPSKKKKPLVTPPIETPIEEGVTPSGISRGSNNGEEEDDHQRHQEQRS